MWFATCPCFPARGRCPPTSLYRTTGSRRPARFSFGRLRRELGSFAGVEPTTTRSSVRDSGLGGLFAVQGSDEGGEAGVDGGGVASGAPFDQEAAEGGENQFGDLDFALVGPSRRADGEQRRKVLLGRLAGEVGVPGRVVHRQAD